MNEKAKTILYVLPLYPRIVKKRHQKKIPLANTSIQAP